MRRIVERRGFWWYRSHLQLYLMRPKPEIAALYARERARAGFRTGGLRVDAWDGRPSAPGAGGRAEPRHGASAKGSAEMDETDAVPVVVGVHARDFTRGTKRAEAPVVPWLVYWDAAVEALEARGARRGTLLIATDSPEALAFLRGRAEETRPPSGSGASTGRGGAGLVVRAAWTRGHHRSPTVTGQVMDIHHGRLIAEEEAMISIVNLLMLVESDVFIGTHSTNFGRLAAELRIAWADDPNPAWLPWRFLDNDAAQWDTKDEMRFKQLRFKSLGRRVWNPQLTGQE
jgi:hypothetical protein